ncbi:PucR family transcriptional regulator [Sporomusa acidovorans]|uniref:PucR C-terminal helix-turn-helix domain-containing protein n=1 Tax=Sporomusa acidovorans (strain ATCC 49682 / DSM 3132 / Mol) TaxID=1123286 RepID=A0ABZ3IZW0_SPOA4|nr:PucR family transcriptional regulator [Sporomusa acidovorans]OZC21397.1 hypothetical protein SPACI_20240 [Sporomusa acidovorans DSM 3132]SDE55302.1 PucR C-terminal helix-turn-helix domain-containing protein [Sporomusa acidovorans]
MGNNIAVEMKFLEQLLDEGIMRIIEDLEMALGKSILLADNREKIFYPLNYMHDEKTCMLLRQIPVIKETEYYFHKTQKMLFYQLGNLEHRLIIGVYNVQQKDILALIEKIHMRSLALKTYLDMQEQLEKQAKSFEKNLIETLIKSSTNIHDIIGFHKIDLRTDQFYGILLLEFANIINIVDISTTLGNFCKQVENSKIFPPILWNDMIVVIIEALDSKDRQAMANIEKMAANWQEKLAGQFGVQPNCGIGRFYMLANLHKSYIEAKISLAFPVIMGKSGSVQAFDNLGVFSMIFSQEIGSLKEYVLEILGPILIYDHEVNMQLVDTLRILLHNDFNWAKTAKEMFVHVNTIYYRYDKIEKMLKLDLSKGKDRNEAFAALIVWDVLTNIGVIENNFFC